MNFFFQLLGMESGTDVGALVSSVWQTTHDPALLTVVAVMTAGVLLACVNFLPVISMRWSTRIITFLTRLAAIGIILTVLLGLEWHVQLDLNEKQQWQILLDDSASMAVQDVDGDSRYAAALKDAQRIRETLGGQAMIATETFSGRPAAAEAGEGPTRFYEAVKRTAFARTNVDRLVLLTDGRDSDTRDLAGLGDELAARGIRLTVRLYGSEQTVRDTGLSAEPERPIIRLGEDLSVKGSVTGGGAGTQLTVQLHENGKKVMDTAVSTDDGGTFGLRYRPSAKGRHTYTVELADAPDLLDSNNRVNFTVDVVEEKINVLLLEGFPGFEFKMMKAALEVDPLVDLVSVCHLPGGGVYVQGTALHRTPEQGLIVSQAELFKYDVVILLDVPRNLFREGGDTMETRLQNLVNFVIKRGGGLIVGGGQDVYRAGGYETSALAEVLPFDLGNSISGKNQFPGTFFSQIPKAAYDHPILQLLTEPTANRERLNSLRKLDGSNNVGRLKPLATPLLTRTVEMEVQDRQVKQTTPILAYMAVGEGKVLASAVDTFWRWQLQPDFDDPPLAALLANAVRYLAPPPGTRPGKPTLTSFDNTPQVGQELVLTTVLKDRNFDPVRQADLQVTVAGPDGQTMRLLPADLPETPGVYEYRVPVDMPGRFEITAVHGNEEFKREFLAGAAAGEFVNLSADRESAARLADAAGGELIDDVQSWYRSVDTAYGRRRVVRDLEVWNSPLALLLFIGVISIDCFVRKRQGLV